MWAGGRAEGRRAGGRTGARTRVRACCSDSFRQIELDFDHRSVKRARQRGLAAPPTAVRVA
eukprot:4967002-Alexandrium_andersonii.AAC.1